MNKLLLRMPNWVGDVVMALPAVSLLQQAGYELGFLTRVGWLQSLLSGFAAPCLKHPRAKWQAIKWLRQEAKKQQFKAVLTFPASLSTALIPRLAGLKVYGYQGDGRSFLLKQGYPKPPHACHKVVYYLHVVQAFLEANGHEFPYDLSQPLEQLQQQISMQLPVLDVHVANAKQLLQQHQVADDYLLLFPLQAQDGNANDKLWPHWYELGQALAAKGKTCVVCPGPGEEQAVQQVLPNAIMISGTDLGTLSGMIQLSHLVVANDTGPMHMAAAIHGRVLGLFAGTSPDIYRPWHGDFLGELNHWPTLQEVLDFVCS